MTKFVCTVCGYEYDPCLGDEENGIPSRTDFEDLGDSWCCPLCGALKEDFEAVEEAE